MDVEERRLIVMKKGLCFYCLKRHLARYCPNQIPCVKCQSGHSDMLHVCQNNGENVENRTQETMVYKPVSSDLNVIEKYASCSPTVPIITLKSIRQGDDHSIVFLCADKYWC